MLNLGKIKNSNIGSHGWYKRLTTDVGVKIFEELNRQVILEYLITKYVDDCCSIRSTKALGFGNVTVGIKNAYEETGEDLEIDLRPVIWMQHINGISLQNYIDKYIEKAPDLTYEIKYDWAIRNLSVVPYILQAQKIIDTIENIGLSAEDHRENFDNFIIDPRGNLHIIDFSYEAQMLQEDIIQNIVSKTQHHLLQKMPQGSHFAQLVKSGLI